MIHFLSLHDTGAFAAGPIVRSHSREAGHKTIVSTMFRILSGSARYPTVE